MSEPLPQYEVFALRYAERPAMRSDNFIGGDPHDAPMPMDYFIWVIRGNGRVIIVDTGFNEEAGVRRGRTFLRCPAASLALIGVDANEIEDVILSHLHYDHAGNFHKFPKARFWLQDREMAYATGRYMRYRRFGHGYEVEEVIGLLRLNYKGRVEFNAGDFDFAPGISLHRTGGHSDGLQIVRVHTRRGWMVLACDATHYYENMQTNRPFPTAFHLGDVIDGYRLVERLAASPDHIIPGHDPLVMKKYPAYSAETAGIVVRLDVPPKAL